MLWAFGMFQFGANTINIVVSILIHGFSYMHAQIELLGQRVCVYSASVLAHCLSSGCCNKVPIDNRYLFLTILEAGKSKIKVPANLVPDGIPLPGLWTYAFLLGPHVAFPHGEISSFLFWKGTNPTMRTPPSDCI